MPIKSEAYNNLPPENQLYFRAICIEWAKRLSKVQLSTPEEEDEFIEFLLDAIEAGEMILMIKGKGEDATGRQSTTGKGERMIVRLNAVMN